MSTVEFRSGVLVGNTRIHTYLHITGPDGTQEAWGFYPAESGLSGLNGAGEVRSDLGVDYSASSEPITLTQQQYDALKQYIDDSTTNPPPYSLPFGSHCTSWAITGLAEIGVIPDLLSPGMVPDNLWSDILQSILWNPLGHVIQHQVNDLLNRALNWILPRDPLALDLDGDGIETLPANGTVLFDHDGDGTKNGTGWIAPDDGILVLDRNGNGLIDNGGELFGDNTIKSDGTRALDGFDALADIDSNGDGLIDTNDGVFSQLRIWRDANSDGISQASELHNLATVNIAGINIAHTVVNNNLGNGNVAFAEGTFIYANGTEGEVGAAASLDLVGYGEMRDLRKAA